MASRLGLFAKYGLTVHLKREVGWATIREKIVYGELEAAQAPAPMLWSMQLGLGCAACDVLTALILNVNGNAITISAALHNSGAVDAQSLREVVRNERRGAAVTFGVVFPIFLAPSSPPGMDARGQGLKPGRDVRIVIVPPAQMYRNLAAGTIDGYCAGEPWNTLAVRSGEGRCVAWSASLQPGHLEKVLVVKARFAEERPREHLGLCGALAEACAWCDGPQNRPELVEILSRAEYLNLPERVIAPALLGRFDGGSGPIDIPDFHIFHREGANVPEVSKAQALQTQLARAGLLTVRVASDLPGRLFREDIYQRSCQTAALQI